MLLKYFQITEYLVIGNGFYCFIYFIGVVPKEPEMLQLANGDIVESAPPIWGIDIKVRKLSKFNNLILLGGQN